MEKSQNMTLNNQMKTKETVIINWFYPKKTWNL